MTDEGATRSVYGVTKLHGVKQLDRWLDSVVMLEQTTRLNNHPSTHDTTDL
jgi:hypothetical protein